MRDFTKALAATAETLGMTAKPEYLEGMAVVLGDFPESDLIAALKVYVRSGRFLPKPVDLIDIMQGGGADTATLQADAAAAWGRLASVLSNAGAVADLCAQSPRVRGGVEALGGWYAALHSDEPEPFKRKRFIEGFCAAAREERKAVAGGQRLEGGQRIEMIEGGQS